MNRANQKAVIQETNMRLVQIRSYELDYFSRFFSDFGTQAALFVGFIAGSLSQAPGYENPNDNPYPLIALYWVSSAFCVGFGLHTLVCCVFLQIFGQSLALRGPVGSMIRALEGMVIEQKHVVQSFVCTFFFFGIQTTGLYWVMFDFPNALACSIINCFGMFYWYHSALRVYNRFFFDSNHENLEWKDDNPIQNMDNDDVAMNDLNPTIINIMHNREHRGMDVLPSLKDDLLNKEEQEQHDKELKKLVKKNKSRGSVFSKTKSIFSKSKSGKSKKGSQISESDMYQESVSEPESNLDSTVFEDDNEEELEQEITHKEAIKHETQGGYLSIKTSNLKKSTYFGKKDPWERKYLVVYKNSLFYYDSKQTFLSNPSDHINRRPIELEGYSIIAGGNKAPYVIGLIPIDPEDDRKAWQFRADTYNELLFWIELLEKNLEKKK